MTLSQQAPSLVERLNELSAWLSEHNIDMQMPVGMIDPAEAAARITELEQKLQATDAAWDDDIRLLTASTARAERAEAQCRVFETRLSYLWKIARDVVMATEQGEDGRWRVDGDAELMLGELYDALETERLLLSLSGGGGREEKGSLPESPSADAGPSPRSHDGGPGYERGSIVWHSSDGDDGPDVGIQLGLGGGYSLYCGELSRATLEDHLIPESYPDGWWVTLYGPTDSWVIGAVPDRYAAQEAVEHLHGLMKSLPAAPDPQAQQDDAASILSDPHAVHLNMLRGGLAKLTPAQIGHLYRGEEAEAVIAELRRQNPKQDEGER